MEVVNQWRTYNTNAKKKQEPTTWSLPYDIFKKKIIMGTGDGFQVSS
jgi:hypothetical protein